MLRDKVYRFLMVIFSLVFFPYSGFCAENVANYIPDAATTSKGMTLWQTIVSGGQLMIVLALLSVAGLGLVIYYFITIRAEKLLPEAFLEESIRLIEDRKYDDARRECTKNKNLISDVFFVGVVRIGRGDEIIKEAMQDEGRRRSDSLWQKLSYLADIAAIAPLVGLLGTVLGMMQAFNGIMFEVGGAKPVLLAAGISKAMITTAAGLIIAIPAMLFYSFFKGRVQEIIAQLENISTELCNLILGKEK